LLINPNGNQTASDAAARRVGALHGTMGALNITCRRRDAILCRFGTGAGNTGATAIEIRGERVRIRMKQRTIQTLYAYWSDLRGERIAPRRLEIEPSRIGSILAETFMLERVDSATYNYRLAGTRLCEIFGVELRGTNILAGWTASDRAAIADNLTSTCEQGAVTLLPSKPAPTRRGASSLRLSCCLSCMPTTPWTA